MIIKLYNTLTREVEPLTPLRKEYVAMYSCGPTVYNYVHIGNLRAFVMTDVIQRVLKAIGGYNVRWVMNITDIDDKIIHDSAAGSNVWQEEMGASSSDAKQNLRAFTRFYEDEFLKDIVSVGLDINHFYKMPRATEYIGEMQELIRAIVKNKFAYISDGSVYFDVTAYEKSYAYGRLFQIDRENFREGVRIDADEYDRENVSDFALWKGKKPGEPFWEFEIEGQQLPGRPGWHIECSAMSHAILGLPIDIHTGGVDLRFPHHEDELAQCCGGYGVSDQSSFWVHNEHLEVEGKKMSKSLGNFFTLRDLIKLGIDPIDLRFALLLAHYRSKLNFTFESLKAAAASRKRIQEFIWDVISVSNGTSTDGVKNESESVSAPSFQYLKKAAEALADDIHTPRALAELNTFVGSVSIGELSAQSASAILSEMKIFNEVFGVWTFSPHSAIEVPTEIVLLAEKRWEARKMKNWSESDRLRDEIANRGWTVMDGKDSYELEPRQ
jgi:cysteinyl-tRNA synthetase